VSPRHLLAIFLCVALFLPRSAPGQDSSPPDRYSPDLSLKQRREWAAVVRREADPESLGTIEEALDDPDPRLRTTLLAYLGEVRLDEDASRGRRLNAIRKLAIEDPSAEVRQAALESLGSLRTEAAAEALLSAIDVLPPHERTAAAEVLSGMRVGRARRAEVIRRAFSEVSSRGTLPPDVLARLLISYGIGLAETESGGDTAADRAPLVLGRTHPDPAVRRGARRALDAFLGRLRELDQHRRADRMLGALIDDGLPVRAVLFNRTVAVLEEGGVDPAVALEGARKLDRSSQGRESWSDLRWRSRAALLEGIALIALERFDGAEEALLRAGDLLDGLIALRIDRSGGLAGFEEQTELLHERSLVEFSRAFRRIAAGGRPDDLALLEILRRAHRLQLEAQWTATAGDTVVVNSMEPFFDAPLSPFRLVFAITPHPAWPPERCISLRRKIGRSLASISAREMPGFDPFPDLPAELADPVLDPRREELLSSIIQAEIDSLTREFDRLRAKAILVAGDDPAIIAEMRRVSLMLSQQEIDGREKGLEERFFDLRVPEPASLQLAVVLLTEGETARCRLIASALLDALEERELPQRYSWAVSLAARAHLAIGGAWTDENEADRAEEEMLEALVLLEDLKSHFREVGAEGMALTMEGAIADALVSLAVNANVKMREPEKALEYFERAYELRQNDYMRILLACYRARSGRPEEARELIRGIPVSPMGYYNLACTYSLLGDLELALELLERDFEETRRSPRALAKQKEWAREDPDLEGLWEDPRFQWLTGTE
jgi:hypothetical protein